MFLCQLDARERQEMTDRRLVSKWLHLKPGAKLSALKIFTRPCCVPPLCITSAEGGQVHLVALEQDLIKCSGLVVWDMGYSLCSFSVSREQKRVEGLRRAWKPQELCCAHTPVFLQLSLLSLWNIPSNINELHLNLSASVGSWSLCHQKRWREIETYTKMCKCTATQGEKKKRKKN